MMVSRPISLKRRLIRSICVGLGISILIPELLAAFVLPNSWGGYLDLSATTRAPQYLNDIAPAFTRAYQIFPASPSSGEPLMGGVNLGMDMVNYDYGAGYLDPNFVPWDPSVSSTPSFVNLSRFRFGYPWRSLTWDDLSTGTSVNIPAVMDYHMKMYDRAGIDRGIGVSFISPGRRLPIAPIWGGLLLNFVFWSIVWFVPGVLRQSIRIHNRKRKGLCTICGYAVQDFEVCPECGNTRINHAAR